MAIGGVLVDSGRFDWEKSGKFPQLTAPYEGFHDMDFEEESGTRAFLLRARREGLRDFGACMAPMTAFHILQGIETLHLRIPRHVDNARKVVAFLAAHPMVETVGYPELPSHPDHALAVRLLPRGARVKTQQVATLEEILTGPAHENDGTFNLFGALATSMATTGYADIPEFHRAEVMVAPALMSEGKQLQREQSVGMGSTGRATVAAAVAVAATVGGTILQTRGESTTAPGAVSKPRAGAPLLQLDFGVRADAQAKALVNAAKLYNAGKRAAAARILSESTAPALGRTPLRRSIMPTYARMAPWSGSVLYLVL